MLYLSFKLLSPLDFSDSLKRKSFGLVNKTSRPNRSFISNDVYSGKGQRLLRPVSHAAHVPLSNETTLG